MKKKKRTKTRTENKILMYYERLCENCEFHEVVEGDYFCYRYPPRVVVIKGEIQSEYPPIDPKVDWCGEFRIIPSEAVVEAEIVE
jgi:hypothetical protein